MDNNVAVRTIVPILFLIGLGFLSRKIGVLKSGDERILNAYVYYFSLPALFFIDMAEMNFTTENLRFAFVSIAPIFIILGIYTLFYLALRFPREKFYLITLTTVFGSLAFFGIPFLMFAFPTKQGEQLATLSAAAISLIAVPISITVLELYQMEKTSICKGLKCVAKRLAKNPLILSIFMGILLSILGLEVPMPFAASFHMLGSTTSTVAIFMLGVFLYGRRYENLAEAFGLSLLRIILLPMVAFFTTLVFGLQTMETTTIVLMHGMPVAISVIVLSERYNFYKETIASTILISSLSAGLYLNLWLLLLGYGL